MATDRALRPTLSEMTDDEAKRAGYQSYLKQYLRCVRGVDDNIKRLLDYLQSEGELDNTLVIYTSDQGMMLGEHDYIDKRWMYDIATDPLEMNNLYGNPEYEEITDRLKEQLKAVRTEVKDSDADYPHIAQIISHHRNGGEAEAIRISHEVAANPVNAKETSDNEKNK